jgi:hypothetical protein
LPTSFGVLRSWTTVGLLSGIFHNYQTNFLLNIKDYQGIEDAHPIIEEETYKKIVINTFKKKILLRISVIFFYKKPKKQERQTISKKENIYTDAKLGLADICKLNYSYAYTCFHFIYLFFSHQK